MSMSLLLRNSIQKPKTCRITLRCIIDKFESMSRIISRESELECEMLESNSDTSSVLGPGFGCTSPQIISDIATNICDT